MHLMSDTQSASIFIPGAHEYSNHANQVVDSYPGLPFAQDLLSHAEYMNVPGSEASTEDNGHPIPDNRGPTHLDCPCASAGKIHIDVPACVCSNIITQVRLPWKNCNTAIPSIAHQTPNDASLKTSRYTLNSNPSNLSAAAICR